ncbi:tRNA (adenosine(37)-N6)-dimethylallyltransferase MiaA [Moheibacter lacus]|uniref:tRNA dimethylallyltransferase n=1 Tax=Moheibacter lacus TaxID=2745851 RepID=A0A838ZJ01_9FLAO|nr:tRNA (adenosine(37)-N6)-dimethylallyltransferase MiaA [Moheibacter lacus]MBA5628334.1 tRNA (adenosine(37)-N6)-dimethylallyltransferase MiaA [Moheibacter lacus]
MNPKKNTLIVITGPTAIGKTGLAVFIAKQLKTEIISFDSRQFYKEMNIGTAVPTKDELAEVPHHFIHNLSIHEDYTVGDFEQDALKKLEELFQKYDSLVMVGGSGMFEKAVTEGLDEFPNVDPKIREELNQEFEIFGIEKLQEEVKNSDPDYYQQVDLNNHHRLIRALEIIRETGKPFSSFRINKSAERNFNIIKIGLELPREEIYERINRRVDLMMENGLLEEVKSLYEFKHLNSLQTVGYRELFDYLDGKIDFDFAVSEIKKNSRRYAKRQLTWYRKDENIHWFSPDKKDEILNLILNLKS